MNNLPIISGWRESRLAAYRDAAASAQCRLAPNRNTFRRQREVAHDRHLNLHTVVNDSVAVLVNKGISISAFLNVP